MIGAAKDACERVALALGALKHCHHKLSVSKGLEVTSKKGACVVLPMRLKIVGKIIDLKVG